MFLGVDTGGTFTDFVLIDTNPADAAARSIRSHKVLSTPDAPERAILQGIREMGLAQPLAEGRLAIVHGSTVATNAALESRGVKTVLITNEGFKDMLSIGRQTRPELFALETPAPTPPVAPELCLECSVRTDAHGNTIQATDSEALVRLADQVQQLAPAAVAINLLFSFLDDSHERAIADHLATHLKPLPFISCSSQVLPEYREYERGIATWLNASLGPLVQGYLLSLQEATRPSPLAVMQSNGGTIAADQAAEKAVNLLLSGPAGGLAAVRFLGQQIGETRLMTFDMGGTSTDVALMDGDFRLTTEGHIGPYPVAVPMMDMHTIGAGGGSIARVDEGGALQVGPRSAGASPGPACYGKGGLQATVTDANLVLGRLPAELKLAGSLAPDLPGARQAIGNIAQKLALTVEEAAAGIINVANEHMARALRGISVEKGHKPGDFRLCCFGGAGGLHICPLAEALSMDRALVPARPGVLSALGMLLAPAERHQSRTLGVLLSELDITAFEALALDLVREGESRLRREHHDSAEFSAAISVDVRYQGQSAWLNLPWISRDELATGFHALHEQRYGHALRKPLEVVNVRVVVSSPSVVQALDEIPQMPEGKSYASARVYGQSEPVPVYERQYLARHQRLQGPVLITEQTATTFIDQGWQASVDAHANLLLEKIFGSD